MQQNWVKIFGGEQMDRKNKTWFWESNRGNKNFFASIENLVMVLTPSKVDNFFKEL